MTGYAITTTESAGGTLTIELKSVNSRFLDLQFRINDDLRALEAPAREAIMSKITRGKVECRISFGRKTTTGGSQTLNSVVLNDIARLQAEIEQRFPSASPLSVYDVLRWPGVLEETQISQDSLQNDVMQAVQTTLSAFIDSRAREGAALQAMLIARIESMETIVQRISPLIPQIIAQFQQKAIERMQEALGIATAGNPGSTNQPELMERIRQEVTLYGIRIDISEELTRLHAHLGETRQILKKGGMVGKRLDFMMQELNREANTVGSKAALKELADGSMELKLLIEQMREQVQNLE